MPLGGSLALCVLLRAVLADVIAIMSSTVPPTEPTADHGHVVAAIADELRIPIDEVHGVYREELRRLDAQARIRQFIPTLAARSTRNLLRGRQMSRTPAGNANVMSQAEGSDHGGARPQR